MMLRLLTIPLLVLGLALPTQAATIEERIAAELQAQGYEILEANRTLLGRSRILAENDESRREIVFNPGTGEILRDYSVLMTVLEQRERDAARVGNASRPVKADPATGAGVAGGPATETVDGAGGEVAGQSTTTAIPDGEGNALETDRMPPLLPEALFLEPSPPSEGE